jgi:methylthioribose-1-phosphate isomerase
MEQSTRVVAAIHWDDGRLVMIDQRALPAQVKYVTCERASHVADAIRSMVVRGAPAIGCAAAYAVALEARSLRNETREAFHRGVKDGITQLRESRPTAVNLAWALARMHGVLEDAKASTNPEIATMLLAEAQAIFDGDLNANREIGRLGSALIADGSRILTHCNAGALATSGHGTALGVVRSAIESGKKVSVVATETRPFLQGARLTVWELAQDGVPATLIADSAAAFLMSRGEIDVVVVGADRIALNGDVANKIGTYALALAARHHAIPFYVAAPLSTFDPALASGEAIPIEERQGDEIRGFGDRQWALPEVAVRNPVFDVTPAALISAIITEKGVLSPPLGKRIGEIFLP